MRSRGWTADQITEAISSTNAVEIFVRLLGEGTDVVRPTKGLRLGPDVIQVLPTIGYDPSVEKWEFPPGSKVRCVPEIRGGRELLVARQPLD